MNQQYQPVSRYNSLGKEEIEAEKAVMKAVCVRTLERGTKIFRWLKKEFEAAVSGILCQACNYR